MSKVICTVLTASLFSNIAVANELTCFSTEDNRGTRLVLDVTEDRVEVLEADSSKVDLKVGFAVDDIQGKVFPFKKILDGTYRYDMGFYYGGSATMLIDEAVAQGLTDKGFAKIRSAGDNGLMTIRFLCKDLR
jgi:hypothetical protein